jgi:adenine/guanine phosphoribosyltransferase-like PRPP-binding protein
MTRRKAKGLNLEVAGMTALGVAFAVAVARAVAVNIAATRIRQELQRRGYY